MCNNCRTTVIALDPATLTAAGAGPIVAAMWLEHTRDCPRTCRWCCGEKSHGNALSCKRLDCKERAREMRARDRLDDIETLLIRTSDADVIARQIGLTDGRALRVWLRKQGRADLIDGLIPLEGAAA